MNRESCTRVIATLMGLIVLGASAACTSSSSESSGANGVVSVAELEPDHLTPGWGNGYNNDMVNALFAPLVRFDANGDLEYVQAKSITSDDNRTWKVVLNEGWTFHNGEPVTAQSYADGINTAAYGPNAWGMNYQFANVEGYDALNPAEGKPAAKTLSGIRVVDETTFTVKLTEPDNQFPVLVTGGYGGWYPLPEAALGDLKAYDEAPIGNGPFEMEGEWEHNSVVRVRPYEGYKGEQPKSDGIEFKIYTSAEAAHTDLLGGNVDLNGIFTSLPTGKLGQAEADFAGRVVVSPLVYVQWIGFPTADPRYSDIRVRQAISRAIDRDAIVEKVFGGLYTKATSLFAPGTVGGTTDSCGENCKFDPDAAKALLAEAGGWSGPMEIYFPPGDDQYAQAIANQVRQNLGISDVKLRAFPTTTEYAAALDEGTTGPFLNGWQGLPTPSDILTGVFDKDSGYNSRSAFYDNPAVNDLVVQARRAADAESATEHFHEAERLIMEDFPVAPVYNIPQVYVYSEQINTPAVTLAGPDLVQLELK